MKTLKLVVVGIVLFLATSLQAQVSVNINIGSPPQWGPVGYNQVEYYYLPDVEAYYDVHNSMFIYYGGGTWIHRTYLPSRYRNYDLYGGYKVVLSDYHGKTPYMHFKNHKVKYKKGYRGHEQKTIGNKPGKGNKHSEGNSHRDYKQGDNGKNSGNNGHDNGKGGKNKGHDKGKGGKR